VGGRSLAFYPIRFDLWKDLKEKHIVVNMSKHPLLVVSRRTFVSGVAKINTLQQDPIVTQLLPRLHMDLGARSFVSGVDCNDPGKSPIIELLVILFFTSLRRLASSCIHNLACFVKLKNYFSENYF
jgi:hypothetical protein